MVSDGLKLFTVQQVRGWLDGTSETEGLDQYVITRSRAGAIVNNPYVKEDDVMASAIYEGGKLAAYTAAFPDMIQGKRSWWFTTLWCEPEHQGKGFGLIVIGAICECHEGEPVFDMWGAPETVEIFRYLGLKDTTVPEYRFPRKMFSSSWKGRLAALKQSMLFSNKPGGKALRRYIGANMFSEQLVDCIDDQTWDWIIKNNYKDAFPRSRQMLDWILSYHFVALASEVSIGRREFADVAPKYEIAGVKVYQGEKLVGFYIFRWNGSEFSVKYNWSNHPAILASIGLKLLQYNPERFSTRDKDISDYIWKMKFYPDGRVDQITFSFPKDFIFNGRIHNGDADNFA